MHVSPYLNQSLSRPHLSLKTFVFQCDSCFCFNSGSNRKESKPPALHTLWTFQVRPSWTHWWPMSCAGQETASCAHSSLVLYFNNVLFSLENHDWLLEKYRLIDLRHIIIMSLHIIIIIVEWMRRQRKWWQSFPGLTYPCCEIPFWSRTMSKRSCRILLFPWLKTTIIVVQCQLGPVRLYSRGWE